MRARIGTSAIPATGFARATLKALLAALLACAALTMVFANPARAELEERGPIDPSNGYPYWYEDEDGLRLELCLDPDDPLCLQPFEMPDPEAPVSFPENFPGESFWWAADAATTTATGGDAQLGMAMEAAWGGADEAVRDGDQMSFGRVRVRVDGLNIGSTYRVIHPYGTDTFVAEDDGKGGGEINSTEDLGCLPGPLSTCDFDEALAGRVGPFLTWDPEVAPAPPSGYVGDPDVEHEVVGSVLRDDEGNPQNYFKVQELNAVGQWVTVAETDRFAVSGKIAGLQLKPEVVGAERPATVFNDAEQKVKLVASDPDADVYYTTDGSPATEQSTPYTHSEDPAEGIGLNSDPAALAGTKTTINYLAVDGEQRAEGSKTFEVDLVAPNLTVSEPAGTHEDSKAVALTTNERARVYYTTDGSNPDPRTGDNPARESFIYDPAAEPGTENVVNVERSQTIRAIAVDLDAANDDGEVNWGQPRSFRYTIAALAAAGPINPLGGYPYWYEDKNGLRLELCLDPNDQMCLQPFESPDPAGEVRFPENFPGEAFWWSGEADLGLPGSKRSILVMAHEAAWGGADEAVRDGDQVVFGRVRVRVDGLQIGQTYRVSHPYGTDTFVAEDDGKGGGEINSTEDLGCGELGPLSECDFDAARFGRVGPFLTWDTFGTDSPDAPPAGYVGDPNVEHVVKGSPVNDADGNPQNYFKLERKDGDDWTTVGETDRFAISGKVSDGLQVNASRTTGFYNEPVEVVLGASEETSQILYTLDGSDPVTNGQPYDGPIDIDRMNAATTLKYVAMTPATETTEAVYSEVHEQVYTLDDIAPTVSANLEPGVFNGPQQVALAADDGPDAADNGTKIYYTTNGSEPTTNSAVFADPIQVDRTQTIKAFAVDAAGNHGRVETFEYTIDTAAPSATSSLAGGTFNAARSVALRTDDSAATVHFTTNGSEPTTASARYSGPITINRTTTLKFFSIDAVGNRSETVTQTYIIRKASVVSMNVSQADLRLGQSRTISGKVAPAHAGKVVKVTVKRNGAQVLVRNLRLNEASAYSLKYKPPSVGRYAVSVSFAGDGDHKPDVSQTGTFRVVRR